MLLNYDPNGGLEFADYVATEWGGEEFERLAAESEADLEDDGTDAIAKSVLADD